MVGVSFRLEAVLRLGPFFLLVLKWRKMRGPSMSVGWEVKGGMFPMASVMVGWRDALLTARGEGPSGRLPHAGAKMSCHRGAMEGSIASGPEIFSLRRHQSSGLLEESSVLKYLSA